MATNDTLHSNGLLDYEDEDAGIPVYEESEESTEQKTNKLESQYNETSIKTADKTADDITAARKKRKMMINLGAAGVVVIFIAFSLFSSWQKAQEQKQAQQAISFEDETEIPTTLPENLPAQNEPKASFEGRPNVQSAQPQPPVAPFPSTEMMPAVTQQATPQITPEQPQSNQASFEGRINELIADLQSADKRMEADIAKLDQNLAAIRSVLRKMEKEYRQSRSAHAHISTEPIKPIEPVKSVQTPSNTPAKRAEGEFRGTAKPTNPIISVGTAPVPEVKVVKMVNTCNEWVVKGAVPGMAWIERDGKLSTVKNGDKIPGVGIVQSIDSVNFEVKTKLEAEASGDGQIHNCTIR